MAMRLRVVSTSYPRFPGDLAGAFVDEHVQWLRGEGHRVDVVAAGDGASHDATSSVRRIADTRGIFYRGGAPETLSAGGRSALAHALAWTARLTAALRRDRRSVDGVIAHWLIPAACAAAAMPGVPLVAIAHSGDVDLLCRTGAAAPFACLLRARATRLVFVAAHLRERFAAAVPAPLARWVRQAEIVPMGVDVARLSMSSRPADSRHIVFLGRMVPIKGVLVLARALPALSARARVTIAGDGPLADQLRASARSCSARFVGRVGGVERDRLLAEADVVLLPSIADGGRVEGFPVTALEAMAVGAAVVASKTGGLAELPAGTVRWVEPGSPGELTKAALALLDDGDERARQITCARSFVETLRWEAVGPKLLPPRTASHCVGA